MSFNIFLIYVSLLCAVTSIFLFQVEDMLSAILFAVFGALAASFIDKESEL